MNNHKRAGLWYLYLPDSWINPTRDWTWNLLAQILKGTVGFTPPPKINFLYYLYKISIWLSSVNGAQREKFSRMGNWMVLCVFHPIHNSAQYNTIYRSYTQQFTTRFYFIFLDRNNTSIQQRFITLIKSDRKYINNVTKEVFFFFL